MTDMKGSGVVTLLRLSAFAAYALALVAKNIMHFERAVALPLAATVIVLWLLIAADYVVQLTHSTSRVAFVRSQPSYPVMLATLPFVTAHNPWVVALPLVTGFVLQLRRAAAGQATVFAVGLSTFMVVLATAGVVYAEQNEPNSTLKDWRAAATWAFAVITHLRGYEAGSPQSPDGIALSFVVALAGLLTATLLASRIVVWMIGDGPRPDHGCKCANRSTASSSASAEAANACSTTSTIDSSDRDASSIAAFPTSRRPLRRASKPSGKRSQS